MIIKMSHNFSFTILNEDITQFRNRVENMYKLRSLDIYLPKLDGTTIIQQTNRQKKLMSRAIHFGKISYMISFPL